jgi:hypothetical protein
MRRRWMPRRLASLFRKRTARPSAALRLSSTRSRVKHRRPLCHPERSRGICSFTQPATHADECAPPSCQSACPITELSPDRSQHRDLRFACPACDVEQSTALPLCHPGAAEGSAVPRTSPGNVFEKSKRRAKAEFLARRCGGKSSLSPHLRSRSQSAP